MCTFISLKFSDVTTLRRAEIDLFRWIHVTFLYNQNGMLGLHLYSF